MQPVDAKRILVYGVTGSGKTTFARRVSERTGIPWHSVDDLTWEPNWVEVPAEVQRERIAEICAGEEWILDTAYAKWIEIPLARVELIIGLDYPRWFSLGRLLLRTAARVIDKKEICNGNRETFWNSLSRDSILAWHFRSFRGKRMRLRDWADNPVGPKVIVFRQDQEAKRWLESLGTPG
ncbi:MAG: adenylate kinase [Fimbriimonadales bacterium]